MADVSPAKMKPIGSVYPCHWTLFYEWPASRRIPGSAVQELYTSSLGCADERARSEESGALSAPTTTTLSPGFASA